MARYLMLVLAAVSLSLAACGKDGNKKDAQPGSGRTLNKGEFPNVPQSVMGQWQAPDELDNGVFVATKIYVNQSLVGVEVNCRRGLDNATVSFAVQATVTNQTIEIREHGKRSQKVGAVTCIADLPVTRLNYFINGNVLTLEDANKSRLQLNRIL